jgi:hypothetical protein
MTAGCFPYGLDCSPEAQARRLAWIADLEGKINSGVKSVTDRGRNVEYRSSEEMQKALDHLREEQAACELGYWPLKASRVRYIPLIKAL